MPPSSDQNVQQMKSDLKNSIKESIYAQDGWGGYTVNQDVGWDVPVSPPHSPKEEKNNVWHGKVNNGKRKSVLKTLLGENFFQ